MKTTLHHSHDKFFKHNLKEKKIAIDFFKAYLPQEIYKKIAMKTLQLTEKSFIIPELKEIHSDIIYKCQINQKPGYLFFLVAHESTAKNELMAFRLLHYMVSLCSEHLQQGHKKLPIICRYVFTMEKSLLIRIQPTYTITLQTRSLREKGLSNPLRWLISLFYRMKKLASMAWFP